MKKAVRILYLFFAYTSFTYFTSCINNESKKDYAQDTLINTERDLSEPKLDSSAEDFQSFKMKMNVKTTIKELKISDLKARGISGNKLNKKRYNEKVVELEEKNNALKTKVESYAEYNPKTWDTFKIHLNNTVNSLEKEFDALDQKN